MREPGQNGPRVAHTCLSALSGGRLRRLGPTEEILLLTSSSFITSYSNGIFLCVQTHPPAPLLTLQTVWQPGWVCVCVCVWLCCACEFVWAISQLCVRVWICVGVCALSSPLTTHAAHKGLSVPKMYHSFLLRGRDGTGVKGWRLRLASGGDNVNLQECDPHHSDWFKRGAWRGERSPAALQQKKWNIIPVTIKPYLRDPFFFSANCRCLSTSRASNGCF